MQIKIKKIIKKGRFFFLELCDTHLNNELPRYRDDDFYANDQNKHNAEVSRVKLHPDTMVEFSLFQGMDISPEKLDEVKKHSEYRTAWNSALRMLSIRAHSVNELRRKLFKKKFSAETVSQVIDECLRLELIDDAKFAKAYIEELIAGGTGRRVIRKKLSDRGVSHELIDRLMEESFSDNDELAAAETAMRKKLPSLKREPDIRRRREKLFRYMASKGFSYDIITSVLGESDILM